jgi:hypothetical protein
MWILLVRPHNAPAYAMAIPAVLLTPLLGSFALPAIAAICVLLVTAVVLSHRSSRL